MLAEALAGAKPAYGAGHRDVLQMGRLLASLYREAGNVSAARRTLEEAVAAGQLQWPNDDPLMLLLAYDLGMVAHEFGNRHEARRNMGLVKSLGPAVLGPSHPIVLAAHNFLDPEATQALPEIAPRNVPRIQPPPHRAAPRGRTQWVVLAIVVAVLVTAAVTAAVVAAWSAGSPPAPEASRQPPTAVLLTDSGDSITLL